MVLVILAVVQIVLLAILVILFLTKGRSDLQNSVPELLTGLTDLRALRRNDLRARFLAICVPCGKTASAIRNKPDRKPRRKRDRRVRNCSNPAGPARRATE